MLLDYEMVRRAAMTFLGISASTTCSGMWRTISNSAAIMRWIYAEFAYEPGTTDVDNEKGTQWIGVEKSWRKHPPIPHHYLSKSY